MRARALAALVTQAANGRAGSGIGGLTATGGLTGGANAVAAAASVGPAPAWLAARHASSSSSSSSAAAAAAAAAEVAPEGEATPSLPRGRPPRSAPPRAKPPPRRPLWWWPLGLGAAPPSRRPLYATAARRPPGSPSPPPRPPYSGGKYMPQPYTTGLTPSGRSADGEARLAAALTRPRAKGAPRATPRRPPTEEAKAKRRATMIATGQWKEKKAAPPQAPPPVPAPAARTRTPLPPPLAPSPPPSPALLASVARLASAVDGGAGPSPGPAAFPARPPGRPSAAAWARYCAAKWAARLADPADEEAQAAGFLGRSVRPGEEEDGGGGGGDGGSGGGEGGGDADGYFSFMGPRGRRAGSPARGGRSASAGRGGRKARGEASASPPHFPPLAPAAPTRADADAAVAALVEADAVAGAALAARFALPPPPASPAGKGRKAGGGRVDTAAGAAAPHHPPHLPSALPMPASAHVVETLRLLRAARAPLSPTLAALARAPAGLARADAPAALGALAAWLRGTGGDGAGLDPGAVGRVLARIPDVLAGTAPPCVGAAAPASSSATPTPRVVPPVAAARAVQAYLARLGVPRAGVGGLIARVPRLLARPLDGPAGLEACVAALSGVARLRRGALEGALAGCPAILLAPPPALASRARFAAARLGLGAPAALARAPSLLARSLAVTGPRAELASRKGVRLTAPGEDPAADAASGCGGGGGGAGAGGASSPTPTPSLSSLPVDALARWPTPRFLAAVGASHAELEEATRAWLGGEGAAWVEAEAGRGAVPKGGAPPFGGE